MRQIRATRALQNIKTQTHKIVPLLTWKSLLGFLGDEMAAVGLLLWLQMDSVSVRHNTVIYKIFMLKIPCVINFALKFFE